MPASRIRVTVGQSTDIFSIQDKLLQKGFTQVPHEEGELASRQYSMRPVLEHDPTVSGKARIILVWRE